MERKPTTGRISSPAQSQPSSSRDDERARVLSVINSFLPGGAERSLLELACGTPQWGIDIEIAVLKDVEPSIEEEIRAAGIPIHRLSGLGRIAQIRRLRRLLRGGRFSLLHTTLFDADIAGRLAAWKTGIPVVTTLANVPYDPIRLRDRNVGPLRLRVVRAVDAITAQRAVTHFHAISEAVKQGAVTALGLSADDVTVIPRGRDTRRLGDPDPERRRKVRERLSIDPAQPVFINVGRQEYQKGQILLLRAMASVGQMLPGAELLIVGREGSATPELTAAVQELGLSDRVRFLGHRSDVADLVCAADVFVFPSLYEGLGGAVLEAMALYVPVVASDIPPLAETLGGTGFLFPSGNVQALAETMADAFSDEEQRRHKVEAARQRFEQHYSLDTIVEATAALFRDTIRSTRGPGRGIGNRPLPE